MSFFDVGQTRRMFLYYMALSAIGFGCAPSNKLRIKNANFPNSPKGRGEIDLLLEPWATSCLKVTNGMKTGQITTVLSPFPPILLGEWQPPLRFKWNGWAVSKDEKQEFPIQVMLSGLNKKGIFVATLIIEGNSLALKKAEAKCIIFSTMLDFGYNPRETREFPLDWKKFVENTDEYRTKTVLEQGTLIESLRQVEAKPFFKAVKEDWTRYVERGREKEVYYSPLNKEKIKEILAINPRYTWTQKLIETVSVTVPFPIPDPMFLPFYFLLDNALKIYGEVYGKNKLPPTGWDYRSQVPSRRDMGMIIKYIHRLLQTLIQEQNQDLFLKDLERGRE